MKKYLASISLILGSLYIISDGNAGPAGAFKTEGTLYNGLRTEKGILCCGNQDCGPIAPGMLRREPNNTLSAYHNGKWYPVPWDAILSVYSHDGKVHLCFWGGQVRCVILPWGM